MRNKKFIAIIMALMLVAMISKRLLAQETHQDTYQNTYQNTHTAPNSDSATQFELQLRDTQTREFEDAPILRLRILDKVRAASRTYELAVDKTVAYSNLRIRPRACRKSSPLNEPESAAFLQIWEVKPDGTSAWVFSGWMFASSPSLSAMDHAVYDVTVLECKSDQDPNANSDESTDPNSDTDSQAESDAQTNSEPEQKTQQDTQQDNGLVTEPDN